MIGRYPFPFGISHQISIKHQQEIAVQEFPRFNEHRDLSPHHSLNYVRSMDFTAALASLAMRQNAWLSRTRPLTASPVQCHLSFLIWGVISKSEQQRMGQKFSTDEPEINTDRHR